MASPTRRGRASLGCAWGAGRECLFGSHYSSYVRRAALIWAFPPETVGVGACPGSGLVGMRYSNQLQSSDRREVVGVGCVQRESVRNGDRGDERIEGASGSLAAGAPKPGGDATERSGRCLVEGKGIEGRFCLLKGGLAAGSLSVSACGQRTSREFGESNGRDQGSLGEHTRIPEARQKNDQVRVQNAGVVCRVGHRDWSMMLSRSRRRASGST